MILISVMLTLRYQPELRKVKFRNFRFRYVQIKPFNSFLLKKIPQKKYYFSAKLLDVEVYYTLIVLITR